MEEEAIAHGRHASVKNLSASEVCFYMSIPGLGGQILLCRRLSNQGSGPRASPDGLSRRGSGIRRGMGSGWLLQRQRTMDSSGRQSK